MQALNDVTLLGYVGNDPEYRTFSGRLMVTFSLATGESWKDKATGEWKEETQWHRCIAWPFASDAMKRAEVKKGGRLLVKGKIKYESWEDKDGNTKHATKIEVRDVIVLRAGKQDSAPAKPESLADFPKALEPQDDDLPF